MNAKKNLFQKKNFLIYGFGKSGFASYKFLKNNNNCKIIDDNLKNVPLKFKRQTLNIKKINQTNFDYIVLSPGIDINKCKLSNYLNKNKSKIITDLDIFYLNYPKILSVAITGTNGKSTTSKLLFEVIKAHKKDVRLTGNIGNPILLEKNITNKTIFIIEASSYQLDYSNYFKSKFSFILNLSPDHLERHGNYKNYIKAKFKIIKNQNINNYAFIQNKNKFLNNLIKKNKVKSKILIVEFIKYKKLSKLIKNEYFSNKANYENLCFVFAISKYLNLRFKKVIKVTNNFKCLNFRQQIIYNSKKLMIINDSKSTSLSSTKPLLETFKNIYWILGGLAKKGDKLKLNKKFFGNIKAIIYGKNKKIFSKILFNKIKYNFSKNIDDSLNLIFKNIVRNSKKKNIILFSPSAASFDQFINFEDRGKFFNKTVKKYIRKL